MAAIVVVLVVAAYGGARDEEREVSQVTRGLSSLAPLIAGGRRMIEDYLACERDRIREKDRRRRCRR